MTVVRIASDGWNQPGSAMFNLAQGLLDSARLVGVNASPLVLDRYTDGRARGGVVTPVLRCLFTGYGTDPSELVHNAGWVPNGRRGAAVASFHDLWAFHDSERSAFLKRMAFRAMARRAQAIVALSEFTRSEVERFLGPPAARKTVVIPVPVATPPALPPVEKRYDALWVGADLPRKALAQLLREARQAPDLSFAVRWTQVRQSAPAEDVAAALAPAPPPNVVQFRERLSDAELDRLYGSARCVVSTSTYEGFHLPILEAYLRALPVVVPSEEPYRELYRDAPGVHYFVRGPGAGQGLSDAIREARSSPPFVPDARVRDWVSPPSVGAQLRGVYESVTRR